MILIRLYNLMFNVSTTRGNQINMQLTHIHYNLQKHIVSNKVIDVWNSLPNKVVCADSINTFLVSSLYNYDLKFGWKAKISGIRSHSLKFNI